MTTKEIITKYRKDAKLKAKRVIRNTDYSKYFTSAVARDKKPPQEATDSTFLYIQATIDDDGQRPLPPEVHPWNSPDIEIIDDAGNNIANNEMQADHQYTITVHVHNDGDMASNSTIVELYLCSMGMGFDTEHGKLIGAQVVAINGHDTALVPFVYKPDQGEIGHKCLFARAYSFTSLDMPVNVSAFDVVNDRHIGQQNTNIIEETETFAFFVVGRNDKDTSYEIKISTGIADVKNLKFSSKKNLTFIRKNLTGMLELHISRKPLAVKHTAHISVTPDKMQPLVAVTKNKWELKLKKDMHALQMKAPDFGLKKREATLLLIELINRKTQKSAGGLTLVIKGK